jgi:hypothetical protein
MVVAVAVGSKQNGITAKRAELPRYFYRLSARAQRAFLKSDAVDRFELVPDAHAFAVTAALTSALAAEAPPVIARAAQALGDKICSLVGVASVQVELRGVRPHNTRGELHGVFYPRGAAQRPAAPLIILWMRTAQRHNVVKPKTFLRTLMHELGHYLDYALLGLDDSFHTSGFFRRESSLMRALCPPAVVRPDA